MASAKVYGMDGSEQQSMELSDAVFAVEPNEVLVKEVIVALQSATHRGTHKTKVRSEVSGGGVKPFRQKGTGRARQGDNREPQMRGGGTVHGPKPHGYRHNIPPRSKRQALACVLSSRLRNDRMSVVAGFQLDGPKTKPVAILIGKLSPEGRKTLLVTADYDNTVVLSTRNMARVCVRTASDVNALDVLNAQRVVVQAEAIAKLEERLS
jgi:large subunit ribosomal protein L4